MASTVPLRFVHLLLLFCLCAVCHGVRATTVIPPTFEELVAGSELVFRGRVTGVQAVWQKGAGREYIATEVTFTIERVLRGTVGETLSLVFLGGRLDGKELHVAGWPRFDVGDRGIFFVEDRNGVLCPLLRLRHGRYRIVADATGEGSERVVRDDRSPLRNVGEVALALGDAGGPPRTARLSDAVSVTEFETQIVEQSARLPLPVLPR